MINIQIPVKVYRGQAADTPLHEKLFHTLAMRRIEIIVRHRDVATGARPSVEDRLTLGFVRRQRLLGNDVCARFHRADDQIVMGTVVFYIESRRFLIRDSPRPATTYEQKTGGADGVKGA